MRDQRARQIRTDFSGMNSARNQHDRLAARDQFRGLLIANSGRTEFSRIGKLRLNLFVLVELSEVRRRADRRHNERLVHRRLTQRFKLHSIARVVQALKILDDLLPRRQFAIVSRNETEHVLRRGNRSPTRGWFLSVLRGRQRYERQKRDQEQQGRESSSHWVCQFPNGNGTRRPETV